MNDRPLYARFYKCDLHMHTPRDHHWRDDSTRLYDTDADERKREIARAYLEACHDVGLEVIAITDHNFAPSPDRPFVWWLRDQNEAVAQEVGRPPLIIFPGFEMEADVGKGCHILCLFPPDAPLQVVHDRLTALGLPVEKRFDRQGRPRQSTVRLPEILQVAQSDPAYTGVAIAPHPFGTKGMCDDERIEMWLQQEEFRNPNLLCIELPKPLDEMPEGLKKLVQGADDCLPEWKRERPIAYTTGSDCHRLHSCSQDASNYIGFRHTWIKMSRPSIEALRQAFLDRDSCIRFGPRSPEEDYTYPQIRRMSVQGASFLKVDPISWSPNLNCLIGSRGTGKSTLLDYLRLALDRLRDGDLPDDLREEINARIHDTLPQDAQVEVALKKPEGEYRVVYSSGQRQVFVTGADAPNPNLDARALFPFRILSQREIDHSVDRRDRKALLRILDDFIHPELDALAAETERLRGRIGEIEAALNTRHEAQKRRAALETENQGIERRLGNLEGLCEPLQRWQGVEAEQRFFEGLFEEAEQVLQTWRERLEDLELQATILTADLKRSPNATLVAEAAELADQAADRLRAAIETALGDFERTMIGDDAPLHQLYRQRWLPLFGHEQQAFEQAQQEAQADGVEPAEIEQLRRRSGELKTELAVLQQQAEEIEELEGQRQEVLAELRRVWQEQTKARQRKAEELMQVLRPRPGAKPLVEIQVAHQGDLDEAVEILAARIPDRRRINEQDIETLVKHLTEQPGTAQPSAVMDRFVAEARAATASLVLQRVFQDRRRDAFLEAYTESVLRALEVERIPDRITYLVYRQDGTLAGPIERVSAGQQGTAILYLLLAGGKEPLVVDTPEEGLDNEGVYLELVPLFRREKEHRQILVVTHNANIPVNADAELIVALDAIGVVPEKTLAEIVQRHAQPLNGDQLRHLAELVLRKDWEDAVRGYLGERQHWSDLVVEQVILAIGSQRQAEGRIKHLQTASQSKGEPAVGALDVPSVKRAVQDIMEGSEEAFRRRREKYGF